MFTEDKIDQMRRELDNPELMVTRIKKENAKNKFIENTKKCLMLMEEILNQNLMSIWKKGGKSLMLIKIIAAIITAFIISMPLLILLHVAFTVNKIEK